MTLKKRLRSITAIVILTLLGVTTLVMAAFVALDYYWHYTSNINALDTKLDTISDQLSTALANPIWTMNFTDTSKIMKSFMKDREVQALYVREPEQFIGYARQRDGTIQSLATTPDRNGLLYSETEIRFNDTVIATLGIYLSPRLRKQELSHHLVNLVAGFFVLILGLVSIIFLVIMKSVIKPLKAIEKYAISVSTASGMAFAGLKGKQSALELANLQKAIQEMVSQLKARYLELEQSRTALERAEKKYRNIFDNAGEGIFQISPGCRLITANPPLAKILGYDSPQEIMESVSDIAGDLYVDPGTGKRLMDRINTRGRADSFVTELFRKDKSIITVSITVNAIVDDGGNPIYYQGMLEDITEKKRAEALKLAKEAAEVATKAKSDFLASMSHEIRTPMNAIMGLTNLALKTRMTAKQQDYLAKIESASRSLLGIINDILDFSKIEAGELKMDHVNFLLDDVWDNLSDLFVDKIAKKRLEFFFIIDDDVPSALVGDPLRVRQVFINLTANALKFTDQGEIIITGSLVERMEDRVRLKFSVTDTGIGIDPGKIQALFTPFTQAEASTTRKYGGTGLGLSICRQLVEMMGGEIRAKSNPMDGTCFTFTAIFGLQPREREPSHTLPGGLRNMGVLVVDDNITCRRFLKRLLNTLGFRPKTAPGGTEAVEMVRQGGKAPAFGMIFMDWSMPDMDGITAARQIKRLPGGSKIPIIMITGFGQETEIQLAEAAGIDAFLFKPITKPLLFNTIVRFFEEKRQSGQEGPRTMITTEVRNKERLKGARILLVEDNEINRQVAVELLEQRGIIVENAGNGKEAVSMVVSRARLPHGFDAVLMDVQMPEMDGLEATRAIREWESAATGRLPIIATTAHAIKGDREQCFDAGMNDYITKPMDPDRLFSTLKKWIHPQGRTKGAGPAYNGLSPGTEDKAEPDTGPADQPVLPDDLPGIAISMGIKRVDGNQALYLKLLQRFVSDHADDVESIKAALKEKQVKLALKLAHTLKGVAGNIEATTLSQLTATLENALKKGAVAIEPLFNRVQGELDRVTDAITTLLKGLPSQSAPHQPAQPLPDLGNITPEIKTMHTLLSQSLMDADNHLEKVSAFLVGSGFKEEARNLNGCMAEFDFDGARGIMETVAEKLNLSL
ncbi:MAG: response regulator [Desulfobacteraceae bacterium]|nr:response regulator [Desulfobacteraceae bacterium]